MSVTRVARPAVLRSLPLDRHVVIEASAGTGKTFTLENLVVELVLGTDLTLDKLLVVTFTEKATHEIRARVRAKLQSLLAGGGAPPTEAQVRAGDYWTLDDRRRQKLEGALHAFDAATIATIHAFCHRVLRENAFASGRCFEEQQVDGRESFSRALRDALRGELARDPESARWLEAALRAGWSIGRIEELLWRCSRERTELRPAFDPATLDAALGAYPVDVARDGRLLMEFKAWGFHPRKSQTVVENLALLADFVEAARASGDTPAFVTEAKEVLTKLRDRVFDMKPRPGRGQEVVAAAIALLDATPPFAAAVVHALLDGVRDELARGKRAAGRYDFDDMLSLVDDALGGAGGSGGAALAEAMRQRWRYTLIDEFQDTDATQWSIFRRAFFAGGDARTPLVLVGDPKQSIYRFRGADVDTYLAAREEILAAGGARVLLESNFRATPALVDATNRIFERDAPAAVFSGAIEYAPVACGRPDRALVDGAGAALSPACALTMRSDLRLADLGAWIAREVQAATDPARPWRIDGRALDPGDVFVLTRNRFEGAEIGAALRAARVPHAFYKEEGLFQSDEARDLRAVLAAIDEPEDTARRVAAWLTPFFGLPLAEVERARNLPATHPLVARLYAWKAIAEARDFDRLFESLVSESGVVRRALFFADGEREITTTTHLLETLIESARGGRATLTDLVQELSGLIARTRLPLDLEGNNKRLESDRRAVQIMTIHKAKGLEAPLVFIAGATGPGPADEVRVFHEDGRRVAWVGRLSADVKPRVDREEAEEEERLMYVALTRAMGRVYLPYFPDAIGASKPMKGPYARVHGRLAELVEAKDPLLAVVDVAPRPASVPPAAAAVWAPPAALLHPADDRPQHDALREAHAATIVTSYTRLRGARPSRGDSAEELRADKSAVAVDEAPSTTLRAARETGVFLHELLERMPIASFAPLASPSLEAWRARPEVAALFDEAMAAHRIDPEQRAHAERLVWSAYKERVALPGGGSLEGFASAAALVREMDFVYPGPHGFVRGSLDMVFDHAPRGDRALTYFADWKSDSLASYAPDAIARHVAAHYGEQVKLYTLAVVKLVGVRSREEHEARFGGILYCFLRGFDGAGRGLWSARPSWDEVVSWEEHLADPRLWRSA
ncbi:MAG TPA: UvrD-helicase domain-containing protein [Polyangiaceae bacterium]|jgi:exodeoxyribonuclease V beta subunit|nr:UvrD-helicase domain-containing protein [Polyangiaceae bacterium]